MAFVCCLSSSLSAFVHHCPKSTAYLSFVLHFFTFVHHPPPLSDVFLPLSTVCSPLSATAFLLALHLLVTPPFHCSLILYTFFLIHSFFFLRLSTTALLLSPFFCDSRPSGATLVRPNELYLAFVYLRLL